VVNARDPEALSREELLDEAIESAGPGLFDLLASAAQDPDAEVRGTAAYGLGEVSDERAVPILVDLVDNDPDETVVLHALKGLETYHDPRIHGVLLHEAERPRETRSPRWYAATQLGRYDSERSVSALRMLLADQDVLVRQAAHESLTTLRPQDQAKWDRLAEDQF
jgi:HEAT repeat protein